MLRFTFRVTDTWQGFPVTKRRLSSKLASAQHTEPLALMDTRQSTQNAVRCTA